MKSALYPAELSTALALGVVAAGIAVLPATPRLAAAAALVCLPVAGWMMQSASAWLWLFLCAALLLPPLPLSIGESGAHPAIIAAGFGVYASAVFAGRWRRAESRIVEPLIALTAIMTASLAMALFYCDAAVAIGSAVRVWLFALGPFVFLYVVSGPGRSLALDGLRPAAFLYAVGALSALFACADFFYQVPAPAGYSPQFIWLADRVLRRAQGVFYDAGALGNICAFFLTMAAVVVVTAPRHRAMHRWLVAAGAVPLTMALVLSYSRAAVLNVAVGVAAVLWLHRDRIRWVRAGLATVAALSLVAGGLATLAPGMTAAWLEHARKTIELALAGSDIALSGRVLSWQVIGQFIVEHPVRTLFGVGYKTLPGSDVLGRPVIADNTYLSTLMETGIAGLIALCALHLAILRETYRAARASDPDAAFYGTWSFAFWMGEMVQMSAADLLTYWRLLPVFFFVIGLAVVRSRRHA